MVKLSGVGDLWFGTSGVNNIPQLAMSAWTVSSPGELSPALPFIVSVLSVGALSNLQ